MSKTEIKYQRVAKKDAEVILKKLIKAFNDPCQNATTYQEDYAGASQQFINRDVVDQLIEKLTR
jgi:hypothetical protein